jgi:Zn-dependent peptidase ImmA (M78 family)
MQCHKINSIDKPTRQSPKRKFPADLPIPGWNKRVMTKSDFSQTCEREGIIMLRLPLPNGINGMYTRMHNTPIIWIDSRLRGTERLRTEFHELGHYFFHDPKALIGIPTKQEKKMRARFEVEANAIALDALAPALRLNSAKRKARRCS